MFGKRKLVGPKISAQQTEVDNQHSLSQGGRQMNIPQVAIHGSQAATLVAGVGR